MSYKDDYKDPRWQKKRLEILGRDKWKCVACGDDKATLHVHHCSYGKKPWDVPDYVLQTLCEGCHEGLGPHPKAGVGYINEKGDDNAYIRIAWCPQCKSKNFKNDSVGNLVCRGCGWRTDSYHYAWTPIEGYDLSVIPFSETGDPSEEQLEAAGKSLLASCLKKVLDNAREEFKCTDMQIFDALFPACNPLKNAYELLIKYSEEVASLAGSGPGTAKQECDLLCEMARVRRRMRDYILLIEAEKQESTDGRAQG